METISTNNNMNYASWLYRFLAAIIDGIILSIASGILNAIFGVKMFDMTTMQDPDAVAQMYKNMLPMYGVSFVINALYYILMESSEKQGTIGKIALGLRVTDLEGNRLTPVKAFLRYIGRFVSTVICLIGYLFPLFTEKKQALHDMIAGTLVFKKDE